MDQDPDKDLRRWQDVEEAAITHYYAIFNDRVSVFSKFITSVFRFLFWLIDTSLSIF